MSIGFDKTKKSSEYHGDLSDITTSNKNQTPIGDTGLDSESISHTDLFQKKLEFYKDKLLQVDDNGQKI